MKQSALFLTASLAIFAYGSQAQNKKVVASPEEGFKAAVIQNLQNAYPSYRDIATPFQHVTVFIHTLHIW